MSETQTQIVGDGFEPDEAGKIAHEMIKANKQINDGMKDRAELEKNLCEMLTSQGRQRIKIEDKDTGESYLFVVNHVESKDKIQIRKEVKKVQEL